MDEIPSLPNLKKKEKERKRGGAWWRWGAADSPFTGAAGGTARVAASAASAGLGALPAESGLFATAAGKLGAAAVALLLAGAGTWAYLRSSASPAARGAFAPDQGAISSSLKIRGGGDGTGRMEVAGGNEIRFTAPSPAPAQAPAAPAPAKAAATDQTADQTPPADDAAAQAQAWAKDRLAHDLSGAKLSSSLGRAFGSKNIFTGGNSFAPHFDAGLSRLPPKPGAAGPLTGMRAAVGSRVGAHSVSRARTSRSLGQLTLAKGFSLRGSQSPSATAAAASAADAFDQQKGIGGALAPITGAGDKAVDNSVVSPPGGGAPDTSMPAAAATPSSTPGDPALQNELGQAGDLANRAGATLHQSQLFMVLALAMIAAGIALIIGAWFAPWIGYAVLAAGMALMALALSMQSQAAKMAKQAEQIGQQVAQQVGPTQGNVVNYCTGQALQGTQVQNCNPPDSVTNASTVDKNNQTALDNQKKAADPGTTTFGAPTSDSGN